MMIFKKQIINSNSYQVMIKFLKTMTNNIIRIRLYLSMFKKILRMMI